MEGKILKTPPSPLPSPARWRGEKEDEKILTVSLTLILSRMGREEMEGKILKDPSPLPSPTAGRGDRKKEKLCKDLNEFLT